MDRDNSCSQAGSMSGFRKGGVPGGPIAPPRVRLREGQPFMLHVTCDLCGKELLPGDDHRYVVKMEVFAAHDPAEITDADLDEDHMEAVSHLLREMEESTVEPEEVEPAHRHFRY